MQKLICPKCKNPSYSSDIHCFSSCPYCEKKFSGEHGTDKRREERTPYGRKRILWYEDETSQN